MEVKIKQSSNINKKFYNFIDILRDANISISTDEVLSLFNSLPYTLIQDKDIFKQTLQTTLIKDYTDIPVFEKCFKKFFEGIEEISNLLDEHSTLLKDSSLTGDDLELLEKNLNEFLENISGNMLFEKTPEDILKLFLDDLINSGSSGQLGIMLIKSRQAVSSSFNNNESDVDTTGNGINNMLIEMIQNSKSKRKIGKEIKNREDYLLNKYIYQLTSDEIKEMKELIKRFGQKLKNRISLRKKRVKHGGIDIKRTFRTSLQYGGVPFKIFYKDKKIDRPQLVVLCDISGSVNQYTRFMLLLTYTLQSLFSRVRTFAFISNMIEITDLFIGMDPERAINSIFSDTDFTYGWGSNYGKSFDQFIDDYSNSLNRKTTVLVLGDARNNNQNPGLDSFHKIKERSRNIFWLNPEKKHLWDWGDSIASIYLPHCIEMKEVNNFLDLSKFIDKLFLNNRY